MSLSKFVSKGESSGETRYFEISSDGTLVTGMASAVRRENKKNKEKLKHRISPNSGNRAQGGIALKYNVEMEIPSLSSFFIVSGTGKRITKAHFLKYLSKVANMVNMSPKLISINEDQANQLISFEGVKDLQTFVQALAETLEVSPSQVFVAIPPIHHKQLPFLVNVISSDDPLEYFSEVINKEISTVLAIGSQVVESSSFLNMREYRFLEERTENPKVIRVRSPVAIPSSDYITSLKMNKMSAAQIKVKKGSESAAYEVGLCYGSEGDAMNDMDLHEGKMELFTTEDRVKKAYPMRWASKRVVEYKGDPMYRLAKVNLQYANYDSQERKRIEAERVNRKRYRDERNTTVASKKDTQIFEVPITPESKVSDCYYQDEKITYVGEENLKGGGRLSDREPISTPNEEDESKQRHGRVVNRKWIFNNIGGGKNNKIHHVSKGNYMFFLAEVWSHIYPEEIEGKKVFQTLKKGQSGRSETHNKGLAIISDEDHSVQLIKQEENFQHVVVDFEGSQLQVVNLYFKNNWAGNKEETENTKCIYDRIKESLEDGPNKVIVLGDFNNSLNVKQRCSKQAKDLIKRILDDFVNITPNGNTYTAGCHKSKIDHILVSESCENMIKNVSLEDTPYSSKHKQIVFEVEGDISQMPNWKPTCLKKKPSDIPIEDKLKITNEIKKGMENRESNYEELSKVVIRVMANEIGFRSGRGKKKVFIPSELKRVFKYVKLLTKVKTHGLTNKVKSDLRDKGLEIDEMPVDEVIEIISEKIKNFEIEWLKIKKNKKQERMQSRRKAYFKSTTNETVNTTLKRIKQASRSGRIGKIKHNKKTISDKKGVEEGLLKFFTKLWESEGVEEIDFEDLGLNPSEEELFLDVERKISEAEVEQVLKYMANNKATGEDEIPMEIYKWSCDDPGYLKIITEVINKMHSDPEVEKNLVTYRIALVPKKSGIIEPSDIRPIALAQTIFRVYTRIIDLRIRDVVMTRLHPAQIAFMNGKPIELHTMRTRAIVDFARISGLPVHMVRIDFEKAYDRVEAKVIEDGFKFIGVNEKERKFLTSRYKNATVKLATAHGETKPFEVNRGIRQGDSLSCTFFNVAMNILVQLIDRHTKGLRVKINENRVIETKSPTFADDIEILAESNEDAQTAMNIIYRFCEATNFKVNIEKTKYIVINGKNTENKFVMYGKQAIQRSDGVKHLRVLGAGIETQKTKLIEKDLKNKIKSFFARVQAPPRVGNHLVKHMINRQLNPQISYKMIAGNLNRKMLATLQNSISHQLCRMNGYNPQMSYDILYTSEDKFGLGYEDIESVVLSRRLNTIYKNIHDEYFKETMLLHGYNLHLTTACEADKFFEHKFLTERAKETFFGELIEMMNANNISLNIDKQYWTELYSAKHTSHFYSDEDFIFVQDAIIRNGLYSIDSIIEKRTEKLKQRLSLNKTNHKGLVVSEEEYKVIQRIQNIEKARVLIRNKVNLKGDDMNALKKGSTVMVPGQDGSRVYIGRIVKKIVFEKSPIGFQIERYGRKNQDDVCMDIIVDGKRKILSHFYSPREDRDTHIFEPVKNIDQRNNPHLSDNSTWVEHPKNVYQIEATEVNKSGAKSQKIRVEDYEKQRERVLYSYRTRRDLDLLSELTHDEKQDEQLYDFEGYKTNMINYANVTEEEMEVIRGVIDKMPNGGELVEFFSDGSMSEEEGIGSGLVVYMKGQFFPVALSVPGSQEIYKAEQHPIRVALMMILEKEKEHSTGNRYLIKSDSRSNVDITRQTSMTWKESISRPCNQTLRDIHKKFDLLKAMGINILVKKVKAHSEEDDLDSTGNNMADSVAKSARTKDIRKEFPTHLVSIKVDGHLNERIISKAVRTQIKGQYFNKLKDRIDIGALIREVEEMTKGRKWAAIGKLGAKLGYSNAFNHRNHKLSKYRAKLVTQFITYTIRKECPVCQSSLEQFNMEDLRIHNRQLIQHLINDCEAFNFTKQVIGQYRDIIKSIKRKGREENLRNPILGNMPFPKRCKIVDALKDSEMKDFEKHIEALLERYKEESTSKQCQKDQQWMIPQSFMNLLNIIYGVEIEGCSSPFNRSINKEIKSVMAFEEDRSFGAYDVDINQVSLSGKMVQINPPYLTGFIRKLIEKTSYEVTTASKPTRVVMVLPMGGENWKAVDSLVKDYKGSVEVRFKERSFPFLSPTMDEIDQEIRLVNNHNRAKFEVGVVVFENDMARYEKPKDPEASRFLKWWCANAGIQEYRVEEAYPKSTIVQRKVTVNNERDWIKQMYQESGDNLNREKKRNVKLLLGMINVASRMIAKIGEDEKQANKESSKSKGKKPKQITQQQDSSISSEDKAESRECIVERVNEESESKGNNKPTKETETVVSKPQSSHEENPQEDRVVLPCYPANQDLYDSLEALIEYAKGNPTINVESYRWKGEVESGYLGTGDIYEVITPSLLKWLNLEQERPVVIVTTDANEDFLKRDYLEQRQRTGNNVMVLIDAHFVCIEEKEDKFVVYDSLRDPENQIRSNKTQELVRQMSGNNLKEIEYVYLGVQVDGTNCAIYASLVHIMRRDNRAVKEIIAKSIEMRSLFHSIRQRVSIAQKVGELGGVLGGIE